MEHVAHWLNANTAKLAAVGIPSARLDCLILLEDATSKDRAWLLAHPEHKLDQPVLGELHKNIAQRMNHQPLAYIRGMSEFYGRIFYVNQHVLVPRPESESIIVLLRQLDLVDRPRIVDVGTGSGALAVTAALELPQAQVSATDVDPTCLEVAQGNAKQHDASINFVQTDLLQDTGSVDVVLANLPYVPDDFPINQAAEHEPRLAIFGGPDGLDLYRRMFAQLGGRRPYILTESLATQHQPLTALAGTFGYQEQASDGLAQLFVAES